MPFLVGECQLIDTGMIQNRHFSTTVVIINSGEND